MRMALVSREYPPETAKGGIGTQTKLKAQGLIARGHQVHVISESTDGEMHQYQEFGIEVIRIANAHHRMEIQTEAVDWITRSVEVAACLDRLHKLTPLDVVDFPEWSGEGYVFLLNRTKWSGSPCAVVHIHGPLVMFAQQIGWPEMTSDFYRVGTAMEETSLRLADGVISSSCYSAAVCKGHYRLDRPIPVIHTGVDTKTFHPLDVPKQTRPTVIFAGKISRAKGVVELVEACCRLASRIPDLKLRMLGRGDQDLVHELRTRAAAYPGLLELPGFMERDKLPVEFSSAHVFAAPSPCEGGPGFVYLEAMACGLPVIACSGTGATEVVKQDETGFLVPHGDADALAKRLNLLLSNEELRIAMGKRARLFVEAEADTGACLDRLEKYYFDVAAFAAAAKVS